MSHDGLTQFRHSPRFESRRHSPSKSRARTSPSKNTREASPTQSVRRSPSTARSRNPVALAYAEANHQPSREIKATAEVNDRMRKSGLANMIKGIVTKTEGRQRIEAHDVGKTGEMPHQVRVRRGQGR